MNVQPKTERAREMKHKITKLSSINRFMYMRVGISLDDVFELNISEVFEWFFLRFFVVFESNKIN